MGKQVKTIDFEPIEEQPVVADTAAPAPQGKTIDFEPIEEPVKKKDEEKSSVNLLPSSGLDEHGQPSGIPTVENSKKLNLMQEKSLQQRQAADLQKLSQQKPLTEEESKRQFDSKNKDAASAKEFVLGPEREKNPLKTGTKSLWNVMSNQLPSSAASAVAMGARDFREPGEFRLTSGLQKEQAKTTKAMAAARKQLLGWATERQQKGAKFTENLTTSLDQINDPLDAVNYVFNAVGQATGQIPVSVATAGASSIMQEVGDTYLKNVQRIARDKKLTVAEVMDKNLDEPGVALAFGVVAGALDKVGAGKVLGSFGKEAFKQSIRNRAKEMVKSVATEAVTEYMQTGLEQIAEEKAAGKTIGEAAQEIFTNPDKKAERREAFVQGGIGGGGITAIGQINTETPKQTIRRQADAVDTKNESSLDEAAKAIQAKVDSAPTINTTDNVPNGQTRDGEGFQQEGPGAASAQPSAATPGEGEALNSTTEPASETAEVPAADTGSEEQASAVEKQNEQPVAEGETRPVQPTADAVEEYKVIPVKGEVKGKNFDYTPNKNIDEEGRSVEGKVAKDLDENYKQRKEQYEQKFGNVIDSDNAKELSEDFKKDPIKNSSSVQRPTSAFLLQLYKDKLKEPTPEGKRNVVAFTAGGPGVGKSMFVKNSENDAAIIYDTNMAPLQVSKNQINRALNAGKDVEINYVYRDPIQSFEDGVIPRSKKTGRIIPIDEFVRLHLESQETMKKIMSEYSGNGRVKITLIDNNDLAGKQVNMLDDLNIQSYKKEDLTNTLNKINERLFKDGKITEAQYLAFKGMPQKETTKNILKIADRILNSDANEVIKSGIKEQGAEYVPKKLNITDKEAKDLIELYGVDKSESLIRDSKNDITGDTRTALTAKLYEKYKADADKETEPVRKQQLYSRAVDIALVGAENAKEAGRAVNANKIWKLITSDEDTMVLAMEKENRNVASKLIAPVQEKLQQSKQQFDEEVRKIIAQKVTEGVETQLARAKLITKEKRQQISDFFDKAKVSTKGQANDITQVVGAAVWNGSMEAVKRAVLAGADVANAVQGGIDYITTNYKGTDFKPEEYRTMMTPQIEPLVPKKEVKAESVEEKIKVPELKGKKKKDFISSVVNEYNAKGVITDERFEELYAKQIGYREYTDEERTQIRELAKIITESEKFVDTVKNDFTKENIAKHKDLLDRARKANQELQKFARQPAQIADTLIAMMQGNLLTPLSIVTNIYSNIALQPLRFISTGVGSVIDRSVSLLARMDVLDRSYRDPNIDLWALQKGYAQGAWEGAIEGAKQIKEGQLAEERDLREVQSSFSPARAIARWADEDRTFNQKINDAIEGTFGWSAEAMFRLLNFGDKPFRRAAERARAIEIGEKRGLKGDDLLKFVMFPDESAQEQIKKAGNEATFQQESKWSKFVQEGITKMLNLVAQTPVIGGAAKVLLKSQVPYVKTPLNIMIETFDYALPVVTLYRGVQEMRNGDRRRGQVLIGKAIVGGIILTAANALFKLGILSWEDDKDKKGRNIQYDTVPPNSINVDALARGMVSGDFSIQDEDSWVNYKKLGIVGIIFDNYTSSYYKAQKEGTSVPNIMTEFIKPTNVINLAGAALEQSFLKGTNSLLNAIQDRGGYETEQWAIETTGAMSSILYPNTIATVSKTSDEFIRDTYNRDFGERLKATYQAKMFMGGSLPVKVNLWGEKVRGNPEGRSKWAYYLFDPTKFKNVDTDSYKYKLYEAWKGDNFNNKWLPAAPDRNETVKGVNMKLTPQEYEKLATYVGEERARAVQGYVNSGWRYHTNEKRLDHLGDIYRSAAARGKQRFLMTTGWSALTKKKLEEMNEKR